MNEKQSAPTKLAYWQVETLRYQNRMSAVASAGILLLFVLVTGIWVGVRQLYDIRESQGSLVTEAGYQDTVDSQEIEIQDLRAQLDALKSTSTEKSSTK